MRLRKGRHKVLVIPDMQIPFQHKDTFRFLEYIKKKVKPTRVVCIGDSVDQHALSDYVHDPDGMSAGDEAAAAQKYLQQFYKIFPKGIEVESNHNKRVFKKAAKAGIPSIYLRSYREFMGAPKGWDFKDSAVIDGVRYEHGDAFGGMQAHMVGAKANMESTVIGHHHSHAGIGYVAGRDKMIFGFNVGCLIDIEAYAFAYAKTTKYKPTLACGVVDEGVPHLYPMILNSRGRWVGK